MGSQLSVIKTLMVPAIISMILFLGSTYVVVPLWQRYRGRYSHYLPLESLSNRTWSLRARMQGGLSQWLSPFSLQQRIQDRLVVVNRGGSDGGYDSEEGEELEEVDELSPRMALDAGWEESDDLTPRLSRDLEQGFRDDSDEEADALGQR